MNKIPRTTCGGYRVSVAQLGSRMHFAVPKILYASGQLDRFYSDFCSAKGWPAIMKYLPASLRSNALERLIGRAPEGIPSSMITAFNSFGWKYAMQRRHASTPAELTEIFLWAGKRFCELIIERGLENSSAIYTFNSAGLELQKYARNKNLLTVMEQTIAPYEIERALLKDEHKAFPGWQLAEEESKFAEEYIAREREEWKHADVILCGSDFVKQSIGMVGGPISRCKVIPYGVDIAIDNPRIRTESDRNRPLRVLTVGEVGIRKGSPYVQIAAKQLKQEAVFKMVGAVSVSSEAKKSLSRDVELMGIVPRSQVMSYFEWADVFLLPSICEGSATVIYEALAKGLPVICTANSGSVVRDGVEGLIVPISDGNALVEALLSLKTDYNLYNKLSESACKRAARFTLNSYGESLRSVFSGHK